jgi:hypothetical protein
MGSMGMPYGLQSMLKEGHKHFSGINEATLKNIEACKGLSQITRTSMGPNGESSGWVPRLVVCTRARARLGGGRGGGKERRFFLLLSSLSLSLLIDQLTGRKKKHTRPPLLLPQTQTQTKQA